MKRASRPAVVLPSLSADVVSALLSGADGRSVLTPGDSLMLPTPEPRFELKYRIDSLLADQIDQVTCFHLEPDEHSEGDGYLVNSLYFDTPDDRDAQETDEGVILRSKVRLRCYSEIPRAPFFLELKQRFGTSIYKTRAAIDDEDAERIAEGEAPVAAYRSGQDTAALDSIREVIDHRDMSPRVWVKYRRRAFTSPWGDRARATFDRDLESQAVVPGSALSPRPGRWGFPEEDSRLVFELKFFGAAPRWMQRLTRDFELARTSCSKYGLSLLSTQSPTGMGRWATDS